MKKNVIVYTVLLSLLLSSCGLSYNVMINKNKLSDFEMKFTNQGFTIRDGETFLLSDKNLKSNNITSMVNVRGITDINFMLKKYKKNKLTNYPVEITQSSTGKKFYGRLGFFNTSKKHENEAVSKYREISVGSEYFASATNGRTAIIYEYFVEGNAISIVTAKIPTWVLLLSDEPL